MKQIAFSFILAILLFCSCGSTATKSEITAEMAYEAGTINIFDYLKK